MRWGLGDVAVGIGLFFAVQLFFGAGLVAFIVAVGGELAVDDSAGDPSNLLLLLVSAPLSWAVLIGWPWWVSRRKGTGRMSADFGLAMRWTDLLLGVAGGVLALVVSASLAVAYSAVFGGDAPTNTDIISGESQSLVTIVVLFVVIAVGTPIAEEIFFRGLVLGAARKRWGTAVGIAFSSLLFGAFHVQADLVGLRRSGHSALRRRVRPVASLVQWAHRCVNRGPHGRERNGDRRRGSHRMNDTVRQRPV